MQFLYFLESIRTPFWDAVMGSVTYLGYETVTIAIPLFIYWCISKKWGCYTLLVSFFFRFFLRFLFGGGGCFCSHTNSAGYRFVIHILIGDIARKRNSNFV